MTCPIPTDLGARIRAQRAEDADADDAGGAHTTRRFARTLPPGGAPLEPIADDRPTLRAVVGGVLMRAALLAAVLVPVLLHLRTAPLP